MNGIELPNHDRFHAQDPYVKLMINKTVKKTKTHKRGGSSPIWNEIIEMPYQSNENVLILQVWDDDTLSDDLIGKFKIIDSLDSIITEDMLMRRSFLCRVCDN